MTASIAPVEPRSAAERRAPGAGEAPAGALIELRDVVKTYRTGKTVTAALRGVSLDVREGEFVGLAGPSGSGKSTLLHVCGLVDQPDRGRYRLAGIDTIGLTAHESALVRRDEIGFVFQTFNLVPVLSASENVELPLLLTGVPAAARARRVADALDEVDLKGHARHRPDELSGGQRQRVAIARALVKRPKLVIADEPTASLDGETATLVIDLLRALGRHHGATVLVATHDPRVTSRCDRVVTLVDGAVS